jgi:Domain of unknown function (DUF4328)
VASFAAEESGKARSTLAEMDQPTVVPLGNRARWAIVLLVVTIAFDVVAIGSDFREISLINRFLDGRDTGTGPLDSSDQRQAIISALQFLALPVTAVFFIRWFRAAYRNLTSLGAPQLRFKPGWAIGAWFVPFLNLWRPKQIADEIWRGSDPEAPEIQQPAALPSEKDRLLNLWWAVWVLSLIVGNIVARLVLSANSLPDIRSADEFDIAALALDIAAAVLATFVIRHMTSRQMRRAELLGA